jgi:hypothetical protein
MIRNANHFGQSPCDPFVVFCNQNAHVIFGAERFIPKAYSNRPRGLSRRNKSSGPESAAEAFSLSRLLILW